MRNAFIFFISFVVQALLLTILFMPSAHAGYGQCLPKLEKPVVGNINQRILVMVDDSLREGFINGIAFSSSENLGYIVNAKIKMEEQTYSIDEQAAPYILCELGYEGVAKFVDKSFTKSKTPSVIMDFENGMFRLSK